MFKFHVVLHIIPHHGELWTGQKSLFCLELPSTCNVSCRVLQNYLPAYRAYEGLSDWWMGPQTGLWGASGTRADSQSLSRLPTPAQSDLLETVGQRQHDITTQQTLYQICYSGWILILHSNVNGLYLYSTFQLLVLYKSHIQSHTSGRGCLHTGCNLGFSILLKELWWGQVERGSTLNTPVAKQPLPPVPPLPQCRP